MDEVDLEELVVLVAVAVVILVECGEVVTNARSVEVGLVMGVGVGMGMETEVV